MLADDALPRQEAIDDVIAEVTPAVVAISFGGERSFNSSGVIISRNGLILSHCHHATSVLVAQKGIHWSRKLPVLLYDGTETDATLLATHTGSSGLIEYSLLKLTQERQWPCADLAVADRPEIGSYCVHFGHPFGWQESRPAVPRLGRVIAANRAGIATTCACVPGDSGGPLVNLHGEIIGVTTGFKGDGGQVDPTVHVNASVIRNNQLVLELQSAVLEKEIRAARISRRIVSGLEPILQAAREITVKIVSEGSTVALGTVVDPCGLIVTKLSELHGDVTVILPNNQVVAAEIVAKSLKRDLALLEVRASGLGQLDAATSEVYRGGLVVSPAALVENSKFGIIGDARIQEIEPRHGLLRIIVEEDSQGLIVKAIRDGIDYAPGVIRVGDLIQRLRGKRVSTFVQFQEFFENTKNVAGNRVDVEVLRDGQALLVRPRLSPNGFDLWGPLDVARELSVRRSGFPCVFLHDSAIGPNDCGGPLLDVNGKVVGINIARAGRDSTYAIPLQIALDFAIRDRSTRGLDSKQQHEPDK